MEDKREVDLLDDLIQSYFFLLYLLFLWLVVLKDIKHAL